MLRVRVHKRGIRSGSHVSEQCLLLHPWQVEQKESEAAPDLKYDTSTLEYMNVVYVALQR